VNFNLPDNLTSWRVQSWAFGKGLTFGDAAITLTSSKPLQLRPLTPRATVVGDVLSLGVQVQNLSKSAHTFQITMATDGATMLDGPEKEIHLAAGQSGQARWQVKLDRAGSATIKFRCKSQDGTLSDGTQINLPVAAMQVPVTISAQGVIEDSEKSMQYALKLSKQDHLKSELNHTTLKVRVDASPAAGALMVLPDLLNYPYGCTEQTLNRFLPAMIAWKSADALGFDWESMQHTITNNQHPQAWVTGRSQYAVSEKSADLSEKKIKAIIYTGLTRLKDLQNPNGWWGWYSSSDPTNQVYLTALAVRGVEKARAAGFALKDNPMKDGADWLESWAKKRAETLRKKSTTPTAQDAFVLYTLSEAGKKDTAKLTELLLSHIEKLPLSAMIHLALAMDGKTDKTPLADLMPRIHRKMIALDNRPVGNSTWWQDRTELQAWYLKLLVKTRADKSLIRQQVIALLALRHNGIHWKSTRDSALCVEAIMEAAIYDKKLIPNDKKKIAITIHAAGSNHKITLEKKNFWSTEVSIPIQTEDIKKESLPIHLTRDGDGPLFSSASITYTSSQPKHMQSVSHGIDVNRQYYRVDRDKKRQELQKGDILHPGDLIEVVIKMTSARNPRFVHLRDPIPAGLEPVVQSSGYNHGAYQESRTGETHFFLSQLSSWNRTQRYWLRAVTPGVASALPARAECMYAPEVLGQAPQRQFSIK